MKKNILVFPDATRSLELYPQINEVVNLIRILQDNDQFKVTVLIRSSKGKSETLKIFYDLGFSPNVAVEIYDFKVPRILSRRLADSMEGFISRAFSFSPGITDLILNSLPFVLMQTIPGVLELRAEKGHALEIYDRIKPDILVHQRDRNVGFSFAMNRLMKKKKLPILLVPWGYVNTAYSVQNRRDSRRNHLDGLQVSVLQWILSVIMPGQVFEFERRKYTFFKTDRWLSALLTGLLPSRPWFFGNDTSICAVSSEAAKQQLIEGGVDPGRLVVTGDPTHDSFYFPPDCIRQKHEQILKEYWNVESGRLIVAALPHLAEHNIMPWDKHWKEIEYIVESLSLLSGSRVLLSLHPRCQHDKYLFLEEKYDVKIAKLPLREFVMAADMFVGTWSGTTEWPVVAGIDTVVLAWFGVSGFGLEHVIPFVSVVERREDLPRLLQKAWKAEARFYAISRATLPPFDGKSSKRIEKLILDLVTNYPVHQKKPSGFRRFIAHFAPSFAR